MLMHAAPLMSFQQANPLDYSPKASPSDSATTTEVGDTGSDLSSMMFMTRESLKHQIPILNTYANTTDHSTLLDLVEYQIPGWTLYQVVLDVENMTAAPEKKSVGNYSVATYSDFFRIWKYDLDLYYDHLAQGFYNLSHDGRLQNFSILYDSPQYDPTNMNYAYLEVRSDYSDGSTNMTTGEQISYVGTTATWKTANQTTLLAANEVYFVVINGSQLQESAGAYPNIRWHCESESGVYETWRRTTSGPSWAERPFEALVNYTYTPWNTTLNQPLGYPNPQAIQTYGNSSTLTGSNWVFSSGTNVSSITFESNQSVFINCNLTLRYSKTVTSATVWSAESSGGILSWNATSVLSYPVAGGIVNRGLNLTLPSDWTAIGLYNDTFPAEDYGNFLQDGNTVSCTGLNDETWTLTCTAPNYVKSISTYDSSDNSEVQDKCSVRVLLDVNSTVESPTAVPAQSGNSNLTVHYQSSSVHTEDTMVTSGMAHHQWDIQSKSSGNGIYSIRVYWSNGSEAGYLTKELVVFYETELTVAEDTISSFTDSSFEVSVFFNDTFTPKGLNSTFAKVNYTFAAVVNNSMFDYPNGTWSKTIDTTGLDSGVYELVIYGEGFAVQNQSTTINVTLIHQTQSLTMDWSSGSNITFVEQTQLSVSYRRVGGVNISNAIVNVTIGVNTWNLTWDAGSEVYRITINGSDSLPGFGSFSPIVSAWKPGHLNQTSATTLIVRPEPVTLSASWTMNQFDWTESVILSFEYRDTYGSLIGQATQKLVWINGTENTLQGDNGTYWIELDSRFDLGHHSVVANVSKYGYVSGYNDTVEFTIIIASTYITIDWSSAEVDYLGRFDLSLSYALDSDDSNVPMGEVYANITIDGTTVLSLNETGIFWTANLTGTFLDLGLHDMVIQTWAYGYEFQTNSTSLTVDEVSTQLTYYWSGPYINNISYIQHTILYINYSTASSGSIEDWTVDVIVEGNPWLASWNSSLSVYECHFSGTDNPPGLGTHSVAIEASKYRYQNQTDNSELTLRVAETSINTAWSTEPPITYVENTTLIAIYSTSSGRIDGANVIATIGGDSWPMNWNIANQDYRIQFNGSNSIPSIGTHNISITAAKSGYAQASDTVGFEIEVEPATLTFDWSPDYNITYFENTLLTIYYKMNSNDSVIKDATLNVTIGTTLWNATWNSGAGAYQIRFNGSDVDPGLGDHTVTVRAWRYGFRALLDENETLVVTKEHTLLQTSWSSPSFDTITYLNSTELQITYEMLNGTAIPNANVTATDGITVWDFNWNPILEFYTIQFNGTDTNLGLGGHNLVIFAWKDHFYNKTAFQTLTIVIEPTSLDVTWSNGFNITFVQYTELIVWYSLANTTAIEGATVNVTIGINSWNLTWYDGDGTYRIRFNGSDDPPGLDNYTLAISAWKHGFLQQVNDTTQLELRREPTNIDITWVPDTPITYLQSIMLYVNFTMRNGSAIPEANVVAELDDESWPLSWNNATRLYELQINGSDASVGTGNHTIYIWAVKTGYVNAYDYTHTIIVQSEPTLLSLTWEAQHGNDITYIETTTLYANYTILDGTPIEDALVNVTIAPMTWIMRWNQTLKLYQIIFNGSDPQPGLDTFYPIVEAWRYGHANQTSLTSLFVRLEPTTLTADWTWTEFEWGETRNLFFEYRDSYGTLIGQATQKLAYVNGSMSLLLGTLGTYRLFLNRSFGLGYHTVVANVSEFGYEVGYNDTVAFSINIASTYLTVDWSTLSTDYLGGFNLAADYGLTRGMWVPIGDIQETGSVNVTVDEMTVLQLNSSGNYWIANLTSASLGLGTHTIRVQAWAYGYENQTETTVLTVDSVATSFTYNWSPANITIQYNRLLNLTVDYTYYGGDVPLTAVVNVTINGRTFNLTPVAGLWEVSLNGSDIGIGVFDATITAWEPIFEGQIVVHPGVNIIAAPNTFFVDPFGPTVSYVEYVDFSVTYTSGSLPITVANVTILLNGTRLQSLTYNATDEKWHIVLAAADIGLGVWNVTISANKTGYDPGVSQRFLTVEEDIPILTPEWTALQVDYITPVDLTIGVNTSDGAPVLDATVWFTMAGSTEVATHLGAGIYYMDLGQYIPVGLHPINVTVIRFAVRRTTWFATLNVTLAAATIQLDYTNTTIYYDGNVNLNVSYSMLNGSYIQGATCSFVINGTPYSIADAIGHWESTIDGTIQGIGLHRCVISVSAYGFDPLVDEFFIQVVQIPTYVNVTGQISNYVNSTIAIEVSYFDGRTSSFIAIGTLSVSWPDIYSVVNQGLGRATILPDTSLHVGNYTLGFTLAKDGHEEIYLELTLELLPIPTVLVVDSQTSEYTNETIVVSAYLNDTHNNRPVSWANVVIRFRGTDYPMEFQPTSQTYTVEIWLRTSIPVGEHDVAFLASAIDCIDAAQNATILIHDKAMYSVAVALSTDEATEGEDIVVTATVTDSGTAVSGITVRFVFTVTPREGVTYDLTMTGITGGAGTAQVSFEIPQGAAQIEVRAASSASRIAWVAHSASQVVTVKQAEDNPLIGLLGDPLVQLLIVFGTVAAIGGVALRSRRKVPTARVPDVGSILQQLALLGSTEFCTLFDLSDRRHVLMRSLESIPESYEVRGIKVLVEEELDKTFERGEEEATIEIQGLKVSSFAGRQLIGVIAAKETVDSEAKAKLQSLVEAFEKEHEAELLDWSKTLHEFETDWVVIGPDASEAENIKALIFINPEGITRADIADLSGIDAKRVNRLVKGILELDRNFTELKSGRKRIVVYQSGMIDEKRDSDTRS